MSNDEYIKSIPTANLVAELKTRPRDELYPRMFFLSIASTPDLVAELASREGVDYTEVDNENDLELYVVGPAKILVVVD